MADPTPTHSRTNRNASEDAPALRLVTDKPLDEVGPFRFERRRQPRWKTGGRVTVVNYGDDSAGQEANKQIGSVQLYDMSAAGVGAWSQQRVPVGSRIAVFFPPHGSQRGFDRYGKVVRCEPDGNGGFDLGVELELHVQHAA